MKPLKEFEINRETKGEVQVLRLVGQLDDYASTRLQAALQGLHQNGHDRVVVNCENLDYLSTTGIRSMVDFAKLARESKGDLLLVGITKKTEQIMQILGHGSEFKIFANEKEAIKQFAPAEPKEGQK